MKITRSAKSANTLEAVPRVSWVSGERVVPSWQRLLNARDSCMMKRARMTIHRVDDGIEDPFRSPYSRTCASPDPSSYSPVYRRRTDRHHPW